MQGEYHKLKPSPSFKHLIESSTAVSREGSEGDLPRYTSLKDVMQASSPRDGASNADPSNIAIRNELVKHAASAYLLSATIATASRDVGIWERIKTSCLGFQSCWQIHVGLPVVELFYRVRDGLMDSELFLGFFLGVFVAVLFLI